MKQATTKIWSETLMLLREIKRLTKETHVLIIHRLIVAELTRLKDNHISEEEIEINW
jgi:hypothetical protein